MALRKPTASLFTVLALIAATVIGLTGPATAATGATDASSATGQEFAAQAKHAGLTGAEAKQLQTTVDGYLAAQGGTQVAANEIALPGKGEIVVALPGERQARDLTGAKSARACPYENFCMYTGTNYTGTQFNLWKCQTYDLSNWNYPGSWINNQTPGTRARFLDRNYNTIYTTPGAYSYSSHYDWAPVWHVIPC